MDSNTVYHLTHNSARDGFTDVDLFRSVDDAIEEARLHDWGKYADMEFVEEGPGFWRSDQTGHTIIARRVR